MSHSRIERRLLEVNRRLQRAREELTVLDQQLVAFADEADETRVRALVSESPHANKEHREAERHAEAMRRSRANLTATIAELERSQDELLDRLVTESR
jgi:recombinational DNA repair ATPase RecF